MPEGPSEASYAEKTLQGRDCDYQSNSAKPQILLALFRVACSDSEGMGTISITNAFSVMNPPALCAVLAACMAQLFPSESSSVSGVSVPDTFQADRSPTRCTDLSANRLFPEGGQTPSENEAGLDPAESRSGQRGRALAVTFPRPQSKNKNTNQ